MANRFAIAPLTTDSSHEDGTATENELEFVRRRAASGFGAVISSAAYVEQGGGTVRSVAHLSARTDLDASDFWRGRSDGDCRTAEDGCLVRGSNSTADSWPFVT